MRTLIFAKRNAGEIIGDPLTVSLGLGFPVMMLLILSALNKSIGQHVPMFEIRTLSPGIAVFGYTFLTLFGAFLIAQDRSSAFLSRLFNSPMKGREFILGYLLPLIPIGIAQTVICFLFAMVFGLKPDGNTFLAIAALIPSEIFYIALGMLFGSLLSDKAVGGVGSILINVATLSAGVWFPLEDMKGSAFYKVCTCLPFYHTVNVGKTAMNGELSLVSFAVVCGSAVLVTLLAVLAFRKKMTSENL